MTLHEWLMNSGNLTKEEWDKQRLEWNRVIDKNSEDHMSINKLINKWWDSIKR